MTTDRIRDGEIEELIETHFTFEKLIHAEGEDGPIANASLHRKTARALRHLLAENQELRKRLEPCTHEEVDAAGGEWWKCRNCEFYIHRDDYP